MSQHLQNQYRQYTQSQARSQAVRRPGPVPPNAQASAHHQQMLNQQMQQRSAAMEHQLAQRRARKPTDKNMPDGIEDLVVGEGVQQYKSLRDVEVNLDLTMMRKRLELGDRFSRSVKRQRTMRIWVSNTASNQSWQNGATGGASFDFNSGGTPTYTVTVEGKLLDEPEDELLEANNQESKEMSEAASSHRANSSHNMTHFFKSITIDFDKARTMNTDLPSQTIEWKKPKDQDFKDVDAIRFQRTGDENLNITINLYRDEEPERYRLSQALAQTLDIDEADRAEVTMGLLEYVKAKGLQEDEEKRAIRCDERLQQIFGQDNVFFTAVPELIMPHLHPLPPYRLPYTIRVDQEYLSNPQPTVHDIRVTTDDQLRAQIKAMMQNPEYHNSLRQIATLDDQLAVIVQGIQHRKARHTFFTSMSRDPAGFTERWTNSQRRDLEVLLGEAGRGAGEDGLGSEFAVGGPGSIWDKDVTHEAVRNALARPLVTGK